MIFNKNIVFQVIVFFSADKTAQTAFSSTPTGYRYINSIAARAEKISRQRRWWVIKAGFASTDNLIVRR
ncbi:TPA: hypothetical protein N2F43_003879 [Salmonella enterica]|nr:hypothetical protein [Salmonella enterica]